MFRKILFISANPNNLPKVNSDLEYKKINSVIMTTRLRENYSLKMIPNATRDDILKIIDEKPYILHIALHGSNIGGIFVMNGKLNSKNKKLAFAIGEEGIAKLLQRTPTIKLLFLNACYSDYIIEHIKVFLDYAIGFKNKVPDSIAVEIAERFYTNLSKSATIFHAYKWTMDEMSIKKELDFNPIFHSKRCLIMNEIAILNKQKKSIESLKSKYIGISDQTLSEIELLEGKVRELVTKHDSARVKVLLQNPYFEIADWFHEKRKELIPMICNRILRREQELQKKFSFDLDMLFDFLDYLLTSYDYKKLDKGRIQKIPRLPKKYYLDALDELKYLVPEEFNNSIDYFTDNTNYLKIILVKENV